MNATGVVVTWNDAQAERRQRLHELLLALIARQEDLELMDADGPSGFTGSGAGEGPAEAARCRHHRPVLQRRLASNDMS